MTPDKNITKNHQIIIKNLKTIFNKINKIFNIHIKNKLKLNRIKKSNKINIIVIEINTIQMYLEMKNLIRMYFYP